MPVQIKVMQRCLQSHLMNTQLARKDTLIMASIHNACVCDSASVIVCFMCVFSINI